MLPPMPSRFGVLAAVFRSSILRRLELAYLIFAYGEWSTWVAVIVYAYGRGGAAEAGIVVFVELAPSVVLAPAVAALGDRFSRDRVLLGTYASQSLVMAVMAIALIAGSDARVIYVLATITATLVALSRPIHAALMPEVVETPDELTAANVVSGMAESAGTLVGPLGAGILLGIGGPAAVFVVAAIGNLCGSVAVLGVARRRHADAQPPHGVRAGARVGVGEPDALVTDRYLETLLAAHHRLTGPRRDPATLPADQQVISASHTDRPDAT
jgi:MFS family permease